MNNIKHDINLFTEIWFKDCFHMSLIPIVKKVLGNADCLMFNQYFIYDIDNTGVIGLNNEFKNIYELLREKNVDILYDYGNNIIETINSLISSGFFVIVGIDNYYETVRTDSYMRQHNGHSIVICGLDYEKQIYYAIEQPYMFSFEYQFIQIPFLDIKKGFDSFLDNRKHGKDFFYNELSEATKIQGKYIPCFCAIKDKIINIQDVDKFSRQNFKQQLCINEQAIFKKLSCIKKYSKKIELYYDLYYKNSKTGSEQIKRICDIINNKKVEYYLFQKLDIVHEDIEEKNSFVIAAWSQIRNYIAKLQYSRKYSITHIKDIQIILQQIYVNEYEYYKIIYKGMKGK